jgi:hypothetical protein
VAAAVLSRAGLFAPEFHSGEHDAGQADHDRQSRDDKGHRHQQAVLLRGGNLSARMVHEQTLRPPWHAWYSPFE